MTDQNDEVKQSRRRSPKYPYLNLPEALDLADRLYDRISDNQVPADAALKSIGYSTDSGSAWRVLSALLQFGLLESKGSKEERYVWLSELALDILLDKVEESPARLDAIRKVALAPPIHQELSSRWDLINSKLPSDAVMETVLVRELGFNRKTVQDFIRKLRETLEYAKLAGYVWEQPSNDNPVSDSDTLEKDMHDSYQPPTHQPAPNPVSYSQPAPGTRQLAFPLLGGGEVVLLVPHALTERDFNKLKAWLELMKDALVIDELEEDEEEDIPY